MRRRAAATCLVEGFWGLCDQLLLLRYRHNGRIEAQCGLDRCSTGLFALLRLTHGKAKQCWLEVHILNIDFSLLRSSRLLSKFLRANRLLLEMVRPLHANLIWLALLLLISHRLQPLKILHTLSHLLSCFATNIFVSRVLMLFERDAWIATAHFDTRSKLLCLLQRSLAFFFNLEFVYILANCPPLRFFLNRSISSVMFDKRCEAICGTNVSSFAYLTAFLTLNMTGV
jgi:hypothetical protein